MCRGTSVKVSYRCGKVAYCLTDLNKEIYIIITHTPSVVSRIIRQFTHTPYNHVSVSLDAELNNMFSFGRRYKYFPWFGGFVQESLTSGTMGRFTETEAIVLKKHVDEEAYHDISNKLRDMLAHKYTYRYDTLGLVMAIFGKSLKRDKHCYCSEFVRRLLVECGVEKSDSFKDIVRPLDFMNLSATREVFRGKLREFPLQAQSIDTGRTPQIN